MDFQIFHYLKINTVLQTRHIFFFRKKNFFKNWPFFWMFFCTLKIFFFELLIDCFRYGLTLQDPDLPQADIDETVAIMELLENLAQFTANYTYFSQGYLFVEKASDSKRLHVIRLEDLKTAMRKHGVGLLPTAVNAAYQLIRSKLQTFMSFLTMDAVRNQIQVNFKFLKFWTKKCFFDWKFFFLEI